jgi:Glycosyl hydrolases family 16
MAAQRKSRNLIIAAGVGGVLCVLATAAAFGSTLEDSHGLQAVGVDRAVLPVLASPSGPVSSSSPSPGVTLARVPRAAPTRKTVSTPSPSGTTSSAPSSSNAPDTDPGPPIPTAVPTGFTRAFTGDFNTPAPLGSFNSVYGSEFGEYDGGASTNGFTEYDSNKVLYVQNGSLYYDLHSEGGVSYAAAPQPWNQKGFLYGQYGISVRLDSSTGPGFKIAFLLWPANNAWTNEVDFPETAPDLTAPAHAGSLITTTSDGPHNFEGNFATGTYLTDGDYHTFLLTWTPTSMTATIDGKVVENFPADSIPSQPMRLSLQAEGWIDNGPVPAATTDILQVPWVYINTYNATN